jgi:hypothetical protein
MIKYHSAQRDGFFLLLFLFLKKEKDRQQTAVSEPRHEDLHLQQTFPCPSAFSGCIIIPNAPKQLDAAQFQPRASLAQFRREV